MTLDYAKHTRTRHTLTPQDQAIPGREERMEPNNAGGFSFTLDPWSQLERFLILGTEGGTYYVDEKELTVRNTTLLTRCLVEDPQRVIKLIVQISDQGRAHKQGQLLFSLARASTDKNVAVRKLALFWALQLVVRTGSHLFEFVKYMLAFGGWNRMRRKAIADWFETSELDDLVYQSIKYAQRDGWSVADLMRLSHPNVPFDFSDATPARTQRRGVLAAITHPDWLQKVGDFDAINIGPRKLGRIIGETDYFTALHDRMKGALDLRGVLTAFPAAHQAKVAANLIKVHKLPREAVPTELLKSHQVWDALLPNLPLHATLRNLGRLTAMSYFENGEPVLIEHRLEQIKNKFLNAEYVTKSRLHPVAVMIAAMQYSSGGGVKHYAKHTPLKWIAEPKIIDMIDQLYDLSYANVVPTGKRIVLGIDVSGSMHYKDSGKNGMTAAKAAAMVALAFMHVEPNIKIVGYTSKRRELPLISARSRMDDVMRQWPAIGEGTDCAVPVREAIKGNWKVDAFVNITDNETWAGQGHSQEFLEVYRREHNPAAKLICLATAANSASIVDEKDPLSLGIVGFDPMVIKLVTDFIR